MRSNINISNKQSTKTKNKSMPISLIILIEIIIVACVLSLINTFPQSTDADIEAGNLNTRSKYGTWMINQHKEHKLNLSTVNKHHHRYIILSHQKYILVPNISKRQLSTKKIQKLYGKDRVFKLQRVNSKNTTKMLIQIKAPHSLNQMPIYSNNK